MTQLRALAAAAVALVAAPALAQTSAAAPPAEQPAAAPAAPAATPAPAAAAPAAPAPAVSGSVGKVTYDLSGWFVLQTYYNTGALAAPLDQARWALPTAPTGYDYGDEEQTAMGVRLSRFRFNIGIPTDGFLAGAETKALIEWDFAGQRGGTYDVWLPRLRHAFFTVTWKDLGNLQLLVGQTWGVVPGPYFPTTITHLAVPRFGGAGILFKRAPQVRLSGGVPLTGPVGLTYTAAVVHNDAGGALVEGEKSGLPMVEGRVSVNYKRGGKQIADLGLFGGYGKELYATTDPVNTGSTTTSRKTASNKEVTQQVVGVDVKIDVPYVSLVGQWFQGQNLDGYNALAAGVRRTTAADPTTSFAPAPRLVTSVEGLKTTGFFGQATVTPVKGLQLAGGYGQETPERQNYTKPSTDTFAAAATATTALAAQITRNEQISGAVIGNLTSRWRVSVEYTNYATTYFAPRAFYGNTTDKRTFKADQIEIGSLLAF